MRARTPPLGHVRAGPTPTVRLGGASDCVRALSPVLVHAREGPLHTRRLGGGRGLGRVRQDVHGIGEGTNRTFYCGLRRLQPREMAAWAYIPSTLAVIRNNELEG